LRTDKHRAQILRRERRSLQLKRLVLRLPALADKVPKVSAGGGSLFNLHNSRQVLRTFPLDNSSVVKAKLHLRVSFLG